ncbi:MAG: hypothetical protein ABL907_05445, partial [Hyphomicrobium sp.]
MCDFGRTDRRCAGSRAGHLPVGAKYRLAAWFLVLGAWASAGPALAAREGTVVNGLAAAELLRGSALQGDATFAINPASNHRIPRAAFIDVAQAAGGDAVVPPVKRERPVTPADNEAAPDAVQSQKPQPAPAAKSDEAVKSVGKAAPETGGPGSGGIFDPVRDWLARANREYQGTIVKELSRPSPADAAAQARKLEAQKADEAKRLDAERTAADAARKAEELKQADAAKKAEEAKKAEAAAKTAEDAKKAEAPVKASDAARKAEEQKQADAQKKAGDAKKADAAKQAEAEKKADDARKAEEAARQAEDNRKAEVAKKAAEGDAEARKLRAAARAAELQRVERERRTAEARKSEALKAEADRQEKAEREAKEAAQAAAKAEAAKAAAIQA